MSFPRKSFSLKLLGGCVLEDAAGPVTGRAVQRRRLACLALVGAAGRDGATRDQLVAYLWPESDAEQARHLLSDTVYVLRSALGQDAVLASADRVALNAEVVACDVTAFLDALRAGDGAGAVEAYGGPFLDGFHISDAPEFERWVDRERERYDGAFARAVEELADAAERESSPAAVRWWRRLAAARPYDGSVARRLATALAAAGDRAGAIRQLEVHGGLLRADLGLEPDPGLVELAEALRRQPHGQAEIRGGAAPAGETREPGRPHPESNASAPSAPPPRAARERRAVPQYRFALAALALLATASAVGGHYRKRGLGEEAVAPGIRRLAVLPFENLGDSADAYFTDGVTDAVRGKLTTLPGLRVTASYSSNQYRHTSKPPGRIGLELGVDYLLVGKVRWVRGPDRESRIQVSPELVEVGSGTDRWQQPFDAALTDVFQVQADIAGQVAQALGVALSDTTRAALAAPPTRSLPAYDALLRGDQLVVTEGRLDPDAFRTAAEAYRAAVRLDSAFGLGWARLAWAESYVYDKVTGPERDSAAATAKLAADRALALAPNLGQTYNAIAAVRHVFYGDYPGAIAAMERARALAPQDVDILTQLAAKKAMFLRRMDEAVALCAEAARLDPRSPLVARRYAAVLWEAGRLHAVDSVASLALRTVPDNLALVQLAAAARLHQGDLAGARAVLRDALAHMPARTLVTGLRGVAWLLDDSLRSLALGLPPEAFSEDRAVGLVALADLDWNEGRYGAARAHAAAARPLLEHEVEQRPADDAPQRTLAEDYAYLGRCAEAVQLRERLRIADRYEPKAAEHIDFAYDRLKLAVTCGDSTGAVAWADTLVHTPGQVTRAWVRLHPAFAPLRGRPDFQRLIAGK